MPRLYRSAPGPPVASDPYYFPRERPVGRTTIIDRVLSPVERPIGRSMSAHLRIAIRPLPPRAHGLSDAELGAIGGGCAKADEACGGGSDCCIGYRCEKVEGPYMTGASYYKCRKI
jgi:hypothetical protein